MRLNDQVVQSLLSNEKYQTRTSHFLKVIGNCKVNVCYIPRNIKKILNLVLDDILKLCFDFRKILNQKISTIKKLELCI